MKLVSVTRADDKHKFVATFEINGHLKHVKFGDRNYQDFTQHKDETRRQAYLLRHKSTEDWNVPTTAGALSRWILWEKPTLKEAITFFRRKFNV